MTKIYIDKLDVTLDVPYLPKESFDYIFAYGLKQCLNDAAAGWTQKEIDSDINAYEECAKKVKARFQQLVDNKPPRMGGNRVGGPAIMTVMIKIAELRARAEFKQAGKKLEPKPLRARAIALVKQFPDVFRRMAQAEMEREAMLQAQLDAAMAPKDMDDAIDQLEDKSNGGYAEEDYNEDGSVNWDDVEEREAASA